MTAQEAAVYAAKIAGVPAMTADLIGGPNGSTFYRATAANTVDDRQVLANPAAEIGIP